METIGSSGPLSSNDPYAGTGWLFITFWAAYFTLVFGILYAVI
jgi:hypothetical protein